MADWISLDEKREIRFTPAEAPHLWMQMKGTDICADVRCACGCEGHIDGFGFYFIKCPGCGLEYEVNGHVQLIERKAEEAGCHPKTFEAN